MIARATFRSIGAPNRSGFALLASWLAVCVSGCMDPELPSYYGAHESSVLPASVNGTDVLAGMFVEAGHDVHFRRTLVTSELASADTIVWFPNDYAAPSEEVCLWFDTWLTAQPGRTLVYVGRDFDAAPLYWDEMTPRVGKDQKASYRRRQYAADEVAQRPKDLPELERACLWFRFETEPRRKADKLSGPWARDVDAAKSGVRSGIQMIPDRPGQQLLFSGSDALVSQYQVRHWQGSSVLLVANGSFLLNLPLVNHENRKLAGRLVAATGEAGDVVFLESGPGGPPVDPPGIDSSLWTLFSAWPLGVVLLQLAAAGVIFCFARWPIFGRPKQPPAESTSDFGMHVEAVGALLARTKDRQFAASLAPQAPGEAAAQPTPAASESQQPGPAPSTPESKGERTGR